MRCEVEGCPKAAKIAGRCAVHYYRKRRGSKLADAVGPKPKAPPAVLVVHCTRELRRYVARAAKTDKTTLSVAAAKLIDGGLLRRARMEAIEKPDANGFIEWPLSPPLPPGTIVTIAGKIYASQTKGRK